jgi:hypothetical protein
MRKRWEPRRSVCKDTLPQVCFITVGLTIGQSTKQQETCTGRISTGAVSDYRRPYQVRELTV